MATQAKPSKDKGDSRYRGITLVHSHICCLVHLRETICGASGIVRPLERTLHETHARICCDSTAKLENDLDSTQHGKFLWCCVCMVGLGRITTVAILISGYFEL